MKIVHIAPCAPYNEGWGYQENLLPKYHYKLGHEVCLIVSDAMHEDGKLTITECCDKIMDDGVRLIRIPSGYSHNRNALEAIRANMNIYPLLCQLKPDYIFFHGLISESILQVVRYKRKINPGCIIVQDNHMDYRNARQIRSKIRRFYYRFLVKRTINYIDKVYGVTPWRKDYAEDYFNVPKNKTDVLLMGADDEVMDFEGRTLHRKVIRDKYNIKDDEYLIVSGGKIDADKNIDILIKACEGIENVRLLLFGSINTNIKDKLLDLIRNSSRVTYVGWIEAKECYKYFYAADLVCFLGTHSVLWEQACASKIACVFKLWPGMNHVDVGGNALLLDKIDEQSLRGTIRSLLFTEKYFAMKKAAESTITDVFRYSFIARKSLDFV